MKNYIQITIVALLLSFTANSQLCSVSVTPPDTTVCPGEQINVVAVANLLSNNQYFDFNIGALPTGWSTSGSSAFSEPCGPNSTGTPYYWASTSATSNPSISTAIYDVTCGGIITFDMMYAIQSGASPCEGPDEADEGVSLQYSTDGGLTWITIVYYSPDGNEYPSNPFVGGGVLPAGNITNYTSWGSFSVTIPPGAMGGNTMFQWTQESPTSGSAYDNWGIDNVTINASGLPCGENAIVNWSNGLNDTTYFDYVASQDTFFVADVYDTLGNYMCSSDTLWINLFTNSLTHTLVDTVYSYCPTDTVAVEVLNIANGQLPVTFDWSTGSTTNPTDIWANVGNLQEMITYYVDITDGCGFVYPDSVVMNVNQLLTIDTLMAFNTSACVPDGAASAMVSGLTTTMGQPFYNWTGPGNPGANNVDATVITDIPSGWYYFTVTDDVCEESDSVFVDMDNPPQAAMAPSVLYGCGPLDVSFVNNSQNTTSYEWDFGGGNVVNVNNANTQSETFMSTTVVQLVAFDDNNCSDTTYATITVDPCGCTDPVATNYNPFATIENGSCIYPEPVVIAPNVFTPNDDGDNDTFHLTVTNSSKIDLTITNRWGNVLYQNEGPNPAWDGSTTSGTQATDGTYFYKYVVTGVDGVTEVDGHGFLQLVRK